MKVCAIMQPTYLPWVGYLDLIDRADVFVFLDNVQFERRSWQQRNQLRGTDSLEWITVPVMKSGRLALRIDEVRIGTGEFPNRHLELIARHYQKATHFDAHWPGLAAVIAAAGEHRSLNRLNQEAIRYLCTRYGIERQIEVAASLPIRASRSDRLVGFCKILGADVYLTPPGAVDYLREDYGAFVDAGIRVVVQSYEHPAWKQLHQPFVPFASSIDLLFNEGPNALAILRGGRRPAVPLDEWPVAA